MSTKSTITRGTANAWTLIIASGVGPVLLSCHRSSIEWFSAASTPATSARGHLLRPDDVPPKDSDGSAEPETYYFSRALVTNVYARPIELDSADITTTTDLELYGS